MLFHRQLVFAFLFVAIPQYVVAQNADVTNLQERLARLERENSALRQRVSMLEFMQQAAGGVERQIKLGNRTVGTMVVARGVWGEARAEDMAAVCMSCAEMICKTITPAKGREPRCMVVHSKYGPMVLSQRGPKGEYIVLINTQGRSWSQVAYQFSHELGHVLCGDLSLRMPQHWFEEAFCESMSLWTLEKLGESWKTNPPYSNWKSYAPFLKNYIKEVRERVESPKDFAAWYKKHQAELTRNAYDRDKNLQLAKWLADEAHKDPAFFKAFYSMRPRDGRSQNNTLQQLFKDWHAGCPAELQKHPRSIKAKLGID